VYLRAPPSEDEEVPVISQLSMEREEEEREKMAGDEMEHTMLVRFDPLTEREEGDEGKENKE
jgi:hypothetical protein